MADGNKRPSKKLTQPLVIPKSAAEEQRLKLDRLMRNPEKQILISERPKDWAPRPPPEFVRDVMGSSAGAGSGEFHVYRHLRRREYMREEFMEKQAGQSEVKGEENIGKESQEGADQNCRSSRRKGKRKESMEQILKPERLTLDPRAVGASNTFDHWLKCFEDYLAASAAVTTDDDRLRVLHARVSDTVYLAIRAATTYPRALELLKKRYTKPPNEIHARYLLATRRRQSGETMEDYANELLQLARGCDCKAVSAEQYMYDLARDAFVAGVGSSYIRLKLLEKGNLNLTQAMELAEMLEAASKSLVLYPEDHVETTWQEQSQIPPRPTGSKCSVMACSHVDPTTAAAPCGLRCYFCGGAKHPRQKCPAKAVVCNLCGKKGHYAKVCRSKPKNGSAACDPSERGSSPSTSKYSRGSSTCESRTAPLRSTELEEDDHQESLRLAPSPMCDSWGRPFWSTMTMSDQQGSSASTSAACSDVHGPTVASITLNQAKHHRLDCSMMDIQVNGRAIYCLFDSGSTELYSP
ncbi:PRKR-interacting protein 1 homolog isoform X1 [Mustelus asterias]